jgi:hypothetical protein
MVKDSKGRSHPNIQKAMGADASMRKPLAKPTAPPMEADHEGEDGEHSELHDHGDGTFHTVVGGQQTEHPHIGHAMMHMAGHHAPDGKHTHVMHHDGGHTSHHHDGGSVSGPHEHATSDEMAEHVKQFADEGDMGSEGMTPPMEDGY